MIAKTVEDPVPKWFERRDQETFAKWYPYVVDNEELRHEIGDLEIIRPMLFNHGDRLPVLSESIEQPPTPGFREKAGAPTRAARDRLADIDRPPQFLGVRFADRCVQGIIASIVDHVDPSALEDRNVTDWMLGLIKKRLRH
ncbi:hypothetical protein J2046_006560 [Rhizobium petrolearium]|nr:hypothetical protein [Neorhizobium petrolearium]